MSVPIRSSMPVSPPPSQVKSMCWGFTHFSKILEYCYYCGNKVYLPSIHIVLVCCVHFECNSRLNLGRKSRGKIEGEMRRQEKRLLIIPVDFLPQILLKSHSKCTQVQGEMKVGKLYFHSNSSILGFLKNG